MNINITINIDPDINLYTLKAVTPNGEIVLECLTRAEIDRLTIGELLKLHEN